MKELIHRLRSETPKFFKKIRTFGLWLMASGVALMMAPENIDLPIYVIELSRHAAAIGFVISTLSSLPKKDPNEDK